MIQYKNCYIIGSSHIAAQSVDDIGAIIEQVRPAIVGVELDKQRFIALVNNISRAPSFRDIRSLGLSGFLFVLVGGFIQKRLGKSVQIAPGADMLAAIKKAKQLSSKVALIDLPLQQTVRRISTDISLREKLRFVKEIVSSLFFPKRKMKEFGFSGKVDLKRVPSDELITKILGYFKRVFPQTFTVLVDDRNKHMAAQIKQLAERAPNIESTTAELTHDVVVVVGAGHLPGIEEELFREDESKQ